MKETYITVPKAWLETLAKLADESEREAVKWQEGEGVLLPLTFCKLYGFASSARTIIKYNKAVKKCLV